MRFRQLTGMTARLVFAMTIVLSIFHIYTAGFGVLQEWRHRAFHLAFVLPLVFFVYSMKKEVHLKGGKHLIYDVLYAGVAAMLNTTVFREILGLSFGPAAALAIVTFALVLYFKQRENLPDRLALSVDLPIYTAMIGFIALRDRAGLDAPGHPLLVRGPQPVADLLGDLPAGDLPRHPGPVLPPVGPVDLYPRPEQDRRLQAGQHALFRSFLRAHVLHDLRLRLSRVQQHRHAGRKPRLRRARRGEFLLPAHPGGGEAKHRRAASDHRHAGADQLLPRALLPRHPGPRHLRPPRLLDLADRRLHVPRHRGHLRHPPGGRGHLRLPLRSLRALHRPDGPCPALHGHRHGAGGLVLGRARQGGRHRQRLHGLHQRLIRGQRGDGGLLHDSPDEEGRLQADLRRRRRGGGRHGRPDHAARHGGRGLHHGRVSGDPLRQDRPVCQSCRH